MNTRDIARFWGHVDIGQPWDCWLWKLSKFHFGHGKFKLEGKNVKSHRIAWELTVRPIPDGLCVLHHCDVPACCNPCHLFLGTLTDNMADCIAKGRRRHPKGEDHYLSKNPEKAARGDAHYLRRRPEMVRRGSQVPTAKINEWQAIGIMASWLQGRVKRRIAETFGVSDVTVCEITKGRTWGHLFANLTV